MRYLKGKSSLMIFDRNANLKYKYGNRHFWCRGYYVDTAGKNAKKIQEYIRNQLKEDFTNLVAPAIGCIAQYANICRVRTKPFNRCKFNIYVGR